MATKIIPELSVTNCAEAAQFFRRHFAFRTSEQIEDDKGISFIALVNKQEIALHLRRRDEAAPASPRDARILLEVDHLDPLQKKLKAAGLTITESTTAQDIPQVKLIGPDGYEICLQQGAAEEAGGITREEWKEAYRSHSGSFRNWLVAFGVGVAVLLMSNDHVWKMMVASTRLPDITIYLLIGIAVQIFLALIDKYMSWMGFYVRAMASTEPHPRKRKIADFWMRHDFPSVIADLATLVFFGLASFEIYRALLPPEETPANVPANVAPSATPEKSAMETQP